MNAGNIMRVFYSYSHKDVGLRSQLETHLSALRRAGSISEWHDRRIESGEEWEKEIDKNLEEANIILLLISADFIASEYCYGKELSRAIEKHMSGDVRVIPIILRACDWQSTIIGKLQALPKDGKPVTSWENIDEAWTSIAAGVRNTIEQIKIRGSIEDNSSDAESPAIPDIRKPLMKVIDRIDHKFHIDDNLIKNSTGFCDLDDILLGIFPGDLVVVAARPGVGKTAFVTNIAEYYAVRHNQPTAIFCMEMSGEQLVIRLLASLGQIHYSRLRSGSLEDSDWPNMTSAVSLFAEAPLFIFDDPIQTISSLRASLIKLRESEDIALVIVDYLQLLEQESGSPIRDAYTTVSRKLKIMAREFDVAVIAVSQLPPSIDYRSDSRPILADLGELGSLEQDADVVLLLYRDEMYTPDSEDRGTADIIVAKNRNGLSSSLRLTFLGSFLRFETHI